MLKTSSVAIYINNECVGEGNLVYNDLSYATIFPRIERHCTVTKMLIDDVEVPVEFCWSDIVSDIVEGIKEREIRASVFVDYAEVGTATVRIFDEYSHASMHKLCSLMVLTSTLNLISSVTQKEN